MATILRTKIDKFIHSIRWKILFAYLLIILIAFSAVAYSLIRLVGDYMFTQRIHDDLRITQSLSDRIEAQADVDAPALYAAIRTATDTENTRVLIIDDEGIVQIDTKNEYNGTLFGNTETEKIASGERTAYGFYSSDGSVPTLNPLTRGGSDLTGLYAGRIKVAAFNGILVYITSVSDISGSLHDIALRMGIWLLVSLALVAVISVSVMRLFTKPIYELSSGIERMSQGDLSARIEVRGRNEFSDLAAAFNSMSEKLEALDNSRSQFVSNASHELKTPLSTMKILIETLLYQDSPDPAMTKDFLGDVNKEIDRLSRIVSDLLTLVNIDSGSAVLKVTDTSLNELIEEQVMRLLPLARENGIEIDTELHDDVRLKLDALKMQQVIYNVIDNAIKYTPRGGTVNVSLEKAGRRVRLTITDTGIGIPEADLSHVFDRFYRVDKARSRATGGTGLGLSIVKQIVLLHNGTISAKSSEGKGTSFIIELPL